eukprot:gene5586-7226_t
MDEDDGDDNFKVVVIGDAGVGKTSIIRQSVLGCFDDKYKPNIGVDFAHKIVDLREGDTVSLLLLDIMGQNRNSPLNRTYFRGAAGVIVVFDLTDRSTFKSIKPWMEIVEQYISPTPHAILLANKCDDAQHAAVTLEEIQAVQSEHNFVAALKTSARANLNIEQAMQILGSRLISKNRNGNETNNVLLESQPSSRCSSICN